MKTLLLAAATLLLAWVTPAAGGGKLVATPYAPARVMYDFYLDNPQKIHGALYWIRALLNPLLEAPYSYAPEELKVVVVIHGTEIVTVAKANESRYQEAVDRMRYYASLGVAFKVCGLAAEDYGYAVQDFQDFIEVVPSAITELAHWQQQGYALIVPQIMDKRIDIESIR